MNISEATARLNKQTDAAIAELQRQHKWLDGIIEQQREQTAILARFLPAAYYYTELMEVEDAWKSQQQKTNMETNRN